MIAAAAAALSDRVFGFEAKWLWTILFGGSRPCSRSPGRSRSSAATCGKFAFWFVVASLGYLTWWVIDKSDLSAFWHAHGKGGFPTFWQGVDLMLACRLVDAARRRLHALRPRASARVLGRVGRLPGPGRLALLARRAAPARANIADPA